MIATGTVRKIDELGRIVIPKSVREQLRIGSRQQIEMYVNERKEITLKKYQPLREEQTIARHFVASLAKATGFGVCVLDDDGMIVGIHENGEELNETALHEDVQSFLASSHLSIPGHSISITRDITAEHTLWMPLLIDASSIGTLLLFSSTHGFTNEDEKLAKVFSSYLNKQLT